MLLVGDQAVERSLERRAGYTVIVSDADAGGRLPVREAQKHQPLGASEAVPDGLVGVLALRQRAVEGSSSGIVQLPAGVEQLEEVMSEQHRALGVPTCEHQEPFDGVTRLEAFGTQEPLYVGCSLARRKLRKRERPRLPVERALSVREERAH
jgi:hypothetical protein